MKSKILSTILTASIFAVMFFSVTSISSAKKTTPYGLTISPEGSTSLTKLVRATKGRYILATYRPNISQPSTLNIKYHTYGINENGSFDSLSGQTNTFNYNPSTDTDGVQTWAVISPFCTADKYVACGVTIEASVEGTLVPPTSYWGYYKPIK